ncbi:unnamed protein product [Echinostoma caproni]|uniref:UV radiation resistance-associated gene protein n=1 Tax=Echinostoma caproni TaxID=27848 RepID=A0A183AYN8_9TREM|nr:unnamed protein product [Echinostoma caproni]
MTQFAENLFSMCHGMKRQLIAELETRKQELDQLQKNSPDNLSLSEKMEQERVLERRVSTLNAQFSAYPRLIRRIRYVVVETLVDRIRSNLAQFVQASVKVAGAKIIAQLLLDMAGCSSQNGTPRLATSHAPHYIPHVFRAALKSIQTSLDLDSVVIHRKLLQLAIPTSTSIEYRPMKDRALKPEQICFDRSLNPDQSDLNPLRVPLDWLPTQLNAGELEKQLAREIRWNPAEMPELSAMFAPVDTLVASHRDRWDTAENGLSV